MQCPYHRVVHRRSFLLRRAVGGRGRGGTLEGEVDSGAEALVEGLVTGLGLPMPMELIALPRRRRRREPPAMRLKDDLRRGPRRVLRPACGGRTHGGDGVTDGGGAFKSDTEGQIQSFPFRREQLNRGGCSPRN